MVGGERTASGFHGPEAVAVVIAVVALLGAIIAIPFVSAYAFWILLLAFIILVAGVMMKGS